MGKEIFTAENKLRYHNSSAHRIAWIHITIFRTCKQNLQCAMYIKSFKLSYPIYFIIIFLFFYGPCSSVGIATDYGLDGPGIESRWGEISARPDWP